jgi:hypothetical protein
MLKLVISPATSNVKAGQTAQFSVSLIATDEPKPRKDQSGEQKVHTPIPNESFGGLYRIPPEEYSWLEDHPRQTRADYAKFKNQPAPPPLQVKWTADNGQIDDNGLYTAPDAAVGTSIVTATSVDNPKDSATATVTVYAKSDNAAVASSEPARTAANAFGTVQHAVPTTPLTPKQMTVLQAAGIPATTNMSALTNEQIAALNSAGVPVSTAGGFRATTPLNARQMQVLATAGIPASSETAVLTPDQLAALLAAGVPATTA